MRWCRKLGSLQRVAARRLERLRQLTLGTQAAPVRRFEAEITYVVVDLLNTWANFVRSYYLSCLFRARTVNNQVIQSAVAFPDTNAALGFAVQRWNRRATPNSAGVWRRRDEPAWQDHRVLLTLSSELRLSNDPTIRAGVSLGAQVLNDLTPFRNFFAHRNAVTHRTAVTIAATYGIFARKPSIALTSRPLGRPQSLLLDWIDEIDIVVEYICE